MPRFAVLEGQGLIAMDIASSLVRSPDYSVQTFSDTENFLAALEDQAFDLGIVDLDSGSRLGGLDAAIRARKERGLRSLFLVNIPSAEELLRIQAASPPGLLEKPFSERELLTAVSLALARARMEELLEESESRYRSLFAESLSPRCILRMEGDRALVVEANRSFRELFELGPGEGNTDFLSLLADTSAARELVPGLQAGASQGGLELKLHGRQGHMVEALASFFTLPGNARGILISAELVDLTESRRLYAELLQAQKMESLGRLASGIAHDFNNIVSAIRGHAEILGLELETEHPAFQEIEGIKLGTDKAGALTRQLLGFARKQAYAPRRFDLAVLLAGIEPLLRRLAGKDIELVVRKPEGALPILADPSQVEQTAVNLLVNAHDALEGRAGGRIRIAAGSGRASPRDFPSGRELGLGDYAWFEVEDNGCGIDSRIAKQIFDPFYTTKTEGRGTGLGLAVVASVAERCSGAVELESSPGQGSVFRVWIPLAPSQEA